MENNLDFLSEVVIVYSKLLLEIGFQWIESYPFYDPEEFLDNYLPSRETILEILQKEHEKIKRQFAVIHEPLKDANMSLYPSLEDMKVDQTIRAQLTAFDAISQRGGQQGVPSAPPLNSHSPINGPVYPDLIDYMGLELSQEVIAANMPEYLRNGNQQQLTTYTAPSMPNNMIAPLSGNSIGLVRAGTTTNGIRELILCKGADGKVGLRVQSINKGVFVCMVIKNSPAALGGLRFGDQILQINGTTVAGHSVDDVHKLLKKSGANNISVVIRDRPFERTVTLHKDSSGCVGFQFKSGKISTIVKDSSAARNGLLIDHQLMEVDGQNVIGMKDKEITKIIQSADRVVTITIMPTFLYEHMIKKLSTSFIKDKMDHSVPDF